MVSISARHAEDLGSIPSGGVVLFASYQNDRSNQQIASIRALFIAAFFKRLYLLLFEYGKFREDATGGRFSDYLFTGVSVFLINCPTFR